MSAGTEMSKMAFTTHIFGLPVGMAGKARDGQASVTLYMASL